MTYRHFNNETTRSSVFKAVTDTETVMRLHSFTRDNLYQIRKRLTAKLQEKATEVLAEMDAPNIAQ